MAIIAQRYVQALFTSSRNSEESIMFQKGLTDISNLFKLNEEFKNLLLNPCVNNEEKLGTLKEMFPEYCDNSTFSNFLSEILRKNRINLIENFADEYSKIINDINKTLNIRIIVASKIKEEQINDIVNKYKEIYKANKVNYTIELDESIIGGVKVVVGNTIYDSSIQTQLKQIF